MSDPVSWPQSYEDAHISSSYDYDPRYRAATRPMSRESSSVASDGGPQPSQQPLKNAIGNAFEKSDAARVVDPNLIAQITEQVKKSVLEEIKMSVASSVQAQPISVTPQYVPQSPTSKSAPVPPRDVYTPPSPKQTDHFSRKAPSPEQFGRDAFLAGNDDTPTPRQGSSAPGEVPSERTAPRPAPAARMTTDEYTPIEKMWQRLFDAEGQPLPRLGQFLRGLALHLIEDYEPKRSLVITPSKMLKFYEEVNLADETYPWQTIFGKLSYSALSKIYQNLRCQHHFVQEHLAEAPYIPALTPEGFQEWMTVMIQAYPNDEYERLAKAVLDMPISNADDRKERFPKELSRRLFPPADNLAAQQRIAAAHIPEGIVSLRKAPSFPPPPPKAQTSNTGPNLERERTPYVSQPERQVFDSEDELESASVPIERQRKPYAATPGGGKLYDDDLHRSATADASIQDQRRRRQSTASQGPWAPPPSEQYYDQAGQARAGAQASTRRPRSPSFSNYNTQSDPSVRDIPNSYYASNLHSFDEDPRRYSKDAEMKRRDSHRRSTAGTDNSYDSQPRSVYHDDDYRVRNGSNGYDNRGYESRRY